MNYCKNCKCNDCKKNLLTEIVKEKKLSEFNSLENYSIYIDNENIDILTVIANDSNDEETFISLICERITFDFTQLIYNYKVSHEETFAKYHIYLDDSNYNNAIYRMLYDIYDKDIDNTSFAEIICKFYNITNELLKQLEMLYNNKKLFFTKTAIVIKK